MKKELLKTRAYVIFLEELIKQTEFAKIKIMEADVINEQTCTIAREVFHKIKGSSGFFGFNDIHHTSSELEKFFKKPMEDLVCEMGTVRELINELNNQINGLPVAEFKAEEKPNA